jgi:hypothetical protein
MKNRRNNIVSFPRPPEEPGTSTIVARIGSEGFAIHLQIEDLQAALPPSVMAKRGTKKALSKIAT